MKIGLFAPLAGPFSTREFVAAFGPEAEARGFESIWLGEHVVLFDDYDSSYPYAPDGKIPAPPDIGMLEPLSTLAFLAGVTERIRLGTGILLLPQRNPVYTAKEVANVDWLSGGRVDLGIGVGWLAEEFEAVDVPWERRGRRTDEYIEILKAMWTEERPSYSGEFYSVPECSMFPKPVQGPHPPFHIGGESDAALRRTARYAQGWYGFNLLPDKVAEHLEKLDRYLEEEGRSRDDIEVSVSPYFNGLTPEMVEQYAEAGVDRVIGLFIAMTMDDLGPALDGLAPCVEAAAAM